MTSVRAENASDTPGMRGVPRNPGQDFPAGGRSRKAEPEKRPPAGGPETGQRKATQGSGLDPGREEGDSGKSW